MRLPSPQSNPTCPRVFPPQWWLGLGPVLIISVTPILAPVFVPVYASSWGVPASDSASAAVLVHPGSCIEISHSYCLRLMRAVDPGIFTDLGFDAWSLQEKSDGKHLLPRRHRLHSPVASCSAGVRFFSVLRISVRAREFVSVNIADIFA